MLKFGDTVVTADGRNYLLSVAPGHGGVSGDYGVFVNTVTGDTRGWVPRKNLGPVKLSRLDVRTLAEVLSTDTITVQVNPQ